MLVLSIVSPILSISICAVCVEFEVCEQKQRWTRVDSGAAGQGRDGRGAPVGAVRHGGHHGAGEVRGAVHGGQYSKPTSLLPGIVQ